MRAALAIVVAATLFAACSAAHPTERASTPTTSVELAWYSNIDPEMAALRTALNEYAAASKTGDVAAIRAAAAKVASAAGALAAVLRTAGLPPADLTSEVRHVQTQLEILQSTGRALSTCGATSDCQLRVHDFTDAFNGTTTAATNLTSDATAPPAATGGGTAAAPAKPGSTTTTGPVGAGTNSGP